MPLLPPLNLLTRFRKCNPALQRARQVFCCRGAKFGVLLALLADSAILSAAQDVTLIPQESIAEPSGGATKSEPSVTEAAEKSARSVEQPGDQKAEANEEGFVDLIGNDVAQHWKHFHSDMTVPLNGVWKIVTRPSETEPDSVLVCSGNPKGFLITNEIYQDFELSIEWKFPKDASGNSGILVYAQDEPRLWPTSMQVQFHQPKAGSVFPSGDATSDNKVEADELARPVNTWNECRVVSRSGNLSVIINGRKPIEVTGAKPSSGRLALQSEGAEVHFRRIRIRKLAPGADPPAPKPPEKAPSDPSASSTTDSSGR